VTKVTFFTQWQLNMNNITLTIEQIEEMLDKAARRGAKEALRSIGLLDDDAQKDIIEMRSLLEAWRDTRKSFWSTVVKLTTVALLTFIAGAVWMTMGK
jgi:2-iminoacetate synthase ThiH